MRPRCIAVLLTSAAMTAGMFVYARTELHWILQEGFLSEHGWDALLAHLARFGIPWSVRQVVPKGGDLLPAPVIGHDKVICIGSYRDRLLMP